MLGRRFGELELALQEYTRSGNECPGLMTAYGTWVVFRQSQRFYLPATHCPITPGRKIDPDLQAVMHLPFPATSVLSEIDDDGTGHRSYAITVACDPFSDWFSGELFDPIGEGIRLRLGDHGRGFIVYSWLRHTSLRSQKPETHGWMPCPLASAFALFDGSDSPHFLSVDLSGGAMKRTRSELQDAFSHDISIVLNLCAVLAASNVGTDEVSAPVRRKPIKRRKKNDKPPSYSYHILNVGGEIWDRPHSHSGTGEGKRSHYRRRHLRRLSDGRFVWVRESFVNGTRRGFVDKDYNVVAGYQPDDKLQSEHDQAAVDYALREERDT